jgi:hypothetical protein
MVIEHGSIICDAFEKYKLSEQSSINIYVSARATLKGLLKITVIEYPSTFN